MAHRARRRPSWKIWKKLATPPRRPDSEAGQPANPAAADPKPPARKRPAATAQLPA